jgi:hypothetical protein
MLEECIWINVHFLPHSKEIIEVGIYSKVDKELKGIWNALGNRRRI